MPKAQVGSHRNGAGLLAISLHAAEITTTYGSQGSNTSILSSALHHEGIRLIQLTSARNSLLAACSAWACHGGLSSVITFGGSGVTSILPGIAIAQAHHHAVLIISIKVRRGYLQAFESHEIDGRSVLSTSCKGVFTVRSGSEIPSTILGAALFAQQGEAGPVAIEVPLELLATVYEYEGTPGKLISDVVRQGRRRREGVREGCPRRSVVSPGSAESRAASQDVAALRDAFGQALPSGSIVLSDLGGPGAALHEDAHEPWRLHSCPSAGDSIAAAVGCAVQHPERLAVAVTTPAGVLAAGGEVLAAQQHGLPLLVIMLNYTAPDAADPLAGISAPPDPAQVAAAFGMSLVTSGPQQEEVTAARLRSALELTAQGRQVLLVLQPLQPGSSLHTPSMLEAVAHNGAKALAQALRSGGVRHVVGGGGRPPFRALLGGLPAHGVKVTMQPAPQSAAAWGEGFGRSGAWGSELVAVLLDAEAASAGEGPLRAISGLEQAVAGAVPMLVLVLGSPGEVPRTASHETMLRALEEVCGAAAVQCAGGASDVELAVVAAATASRELHEDGRIEMKAPELRVPAGKGQTAKHARAGVFKLQQSWNENVLGAGVGERLQGRPHPVVVELPREALVDPQSAPPPPPCLAAMRRAKLALPVAGLLGAAELALAAEQVASKLLAAQQPRVHLDLGTKNPRCSKLVETVADAAAACISAAFSVKGVVSEAHPLYLCTGGLLSEPTTLPSPLQAIAHDVDCLLVIGGRIEETGTKLPGVCFYVDATAGVQQPPWSSSGSEAPDGIFADPGDFLEALVEALGGRTRGDGPGARDGLSMRLAAAQDCVRQAAAVQAQELGLAHPRQCSAVAVVRSLQSAVPDGTLFDAEPGACALILAEHLCLLRPAHPLVPRHSGAAGQCLASLAGAAAAAEGALSATPTLVAVTHPEGLLLSVADLAAATAARLPLIVVVLAGEGGVNMSEVLHRAVGGGGGGGGVSMRAGQTLAPLAAALRVPWREVTALGEVEASVAWAVQSVARETAGPVMLEIRSAEYGTSESMQLSGMLRAALTEGNGGCEAAAHPPPQEEWTQEEGELWHLPARRRRAGGVEEVWARELLALFQGGSEGAASCHVWNISEHAAAQHGRRLAVVDGSVRRDYSELCGRIRSMAAWLRASGVAATAGERVAVLLPNSVECLEVHFAVAGAGCVVLNLNYRLAATELAGILLDAEPRMAVAHAQFHELLTQAQALAPFIFQGLLWVGDKADSTPGLEWYEDTVGAAAAGQCGAEATGPGAGDPDAGCEMYYTSGTTGRPKGIVLSQRVVVLHALGCMVEHRIHAGEVWGHFAPMFHLVDAYAMFAVTWVGGVHVMLPRFTAAAVLDLIERERVTATNVAATMITMLLAHPGVGRRDLRSLELVSCGGAPLNRVEVLRALEVFDCEFFLSYGMSECCGKISMSLLDAEMRALPPAVQLDYVCTSGRAFGLTEVRVVDVETEEDVAADGVSAGEVWIRGPTVMKGYWRNEAATASAFAPGGWFKTGDLATVEHRGYITVCDRKKDMILTGSENVFAMEVELVIASHSQVKFVAVYGVPDGLLGEAVKAVVTLHPQHVGAVGAAELRAWCAKQLADYKVPRHVEFLDELQMPLTGSGKVAKAALKASDSERRASTGSAPRHSTNTTSSSSSAANSAAAVAAPAAIEPRGRRKARAPSETLPLDGDTYHIRWRLAGLPAPAAGAHEGAWLLLMEARANMTGASLEEALCRTGATTVRALAADDSAAAMLRAGSPEGVAFVKALAQRAGPGGLQVVCLWPLDYCEPMAGAEAAVQAARVLLEMLLGLAQALARAQMKAQLTVVTRGAAVRLDDDAGGGLEACGRDGSAPLQPSAAQQAVWGFTRVVAAELPGVSCALVDLCPGERQAPADARILLQELLSGKTGEAPGGGSRGGRGRESAWRRRQRYTPALAQLPGLRTIRLSPFDSAGCYVVTGGLGGLGLRLSEYLAAWGAKKVVLVSRRGASEEAQARLRRVEVRYRAQICVERGDVGKRADVMRVLRAAHSADRPCRGVFHLAGVVDDGGIAALTWERFGKVLTAKVEGSMHLHEAAVQLQLPLEHFVLFTSIYGLLGYRELAHYAAANAYQDGLAMARRRAGLAGSAVSWGTWAGAGMAHDFGAGFEAYWTGQGMRFVDLERGMATLHALLALEEVHAAVLPADWGVYAKRNVGQVHPLLERLVQSAGQPSPKETKRAGPDSTSAGTSAGTTSAVPGAVGGPLPDVPGAMPLVELGLTSMLVVDLMTQLSDAYQLDLSPTLVYEAVNVEGLARHILGQLTSSAAADLPVPVADGARAAAVQAQLEEVLREVLGESASGQDPETPLVDLGLSSMHAVELTTRLQDAFDLPDLSPTLVYEAVTLKGIRVHLLGLLCPLPPEPAATLAPAPAPAILATGLPVLGITGLAGRLPGESNTVEDLWKGVLVAERDCIVDPPEGRPSNGRPSGFLTAAQVTRFDRGAFAISAGEAAAMDPQQRLLLECSQEIFEDAGVVLSKLVSRDIGVYVALETMDYAVLHQESGEEPSPYCGTGWHMAIASNRISYVLDLSGPSMAINTACSSSLVCVDTALSALQYKGLAMAVVGGANIQLRRVWSDAFAIAGMLSPSFKCQFGDDAADGYVRGEGVAAALLARVDPPQTPSARPGGEARGTEAYALLLGCALYQDGHSNGLMAPKPAAQEELLKRAYVAAGESPGRVAYVEAHGTGTRLGDPIELTALGSAGVGAAAGLQVGTIKSNIGHLECAAGMAGLIKGLLVLQRATVPASLHFRTPNQLVDFQRLRVTVAAVAAPLAAPQDPAAHTIVGISGNGFGGTLGHCVIARHKPSAPPAAVAVSRHPLLQSTPPPQSGKSLVVLPLSGSSMAAVRATAKRLAHQLKDMVAADLPALATAAHTSREHLGPPWRFKAAVAGAAPGSLAAMLHAIAIGEEEDLEEEMTGSGAAQVGEVDSAGAGRARRVALVFTGQGAEYACMGRALAATDESFAAALAAAEAALAPHLRPEHRDGLRAALRGEPSVEAGRAALSTAAVLQPATFALEYALAQALLSRLADPPVAVAGHSLGELAAVVAAGVLSLSEAAALVAGRGRAMSELPAGVSGMAVIRSAEAEVRAVLGRLPHLKVEVAAVNSPVCTTLSGELSEVDAAVAACSTGGMRARKLQVLAGMHSACIDPCLPSLRAAASAVLPQGGRGLATGALPMVSTRTGARLEAVPDAEYWVQQARGCVQFATAVECLVGDCGAEVLIEVGPASHLTVHIKDTLTAARGPAAAPIPVLPTLKGEKAAKSEPGALSAALAALHCAGAALRPLPAHLDTQLPPALPRLPLTALLGAPYWYHANLAEEGTAATVTKQQKQGAQRATGPASVSAKPPLEEAPGLVYVGEWEEEELEAPRRSAVGEPPVRTALVLGNRGCMLTRLMVNELLRRGVAEVQPFEMNRPHASERITEAVRAGPAGANGGRRGVGTPPQWDLVVLVTGVSTTEVDAGRGKLARSDSIGSNTSTETFSCEWMPAGHLGALGSRMLSNNELGTFGSMDHTMVEIDEVGLLNAPLLEGGTSSSPIRGSMSRYGSHADMFLAGGGGGAAHETEAQLSADQVVAVSGALLQLLQEVQMTPGTAKRVAVVTQGAHGQPGSSSGGVGMGSAGGAAAWGLMRSARQELELLPAPPQLQMIDLDHEASAAVAGSAVAAELLAPSRVFGRDDVRLRFRGDARLVRRLAAQGRPCPVRAALAATTPKRPPKKSTAAMVAITGGTGALGLVVGKHLVEHRGCLYLWLLSRSGTVTRENAPLYEALLVAADQAGASVELVRCDVADEAQVLHFLHQHGAQLGAVVHAAGVLDDGSMGSQTRPRLRHQLEAKALSAMHLLKGCQMHAPKLSLFVMFSSVTALLGNKGQVGYGAANAVLDYLAALGQSLGVTALAIQWGPWDEVGMAVRSSGKAVSKTSVYQPLQVKEALAALDVLLDGAVDCQAAPVAAVTHFDWRNVARQTHDSAFQARLWSGILRDGGEAPVATTTRQPKGRRVAKAEARQRVEEELEQILRRFHESSELPKPLPPGMLLADLGLDSIDSMSVVHEINRVFGINSSVVDLFEANTVRNLVTYIKSNAKLAHMPAPTPAPIHAATPAAVPRKQRALDMMAVVVGTIHEQMGKDRGEMQLHGGTVLVDLALDSIEFMVLLQKLNKRCGVDLGVADALECASLHDLVQALHRACGSSSAPPMAAASPRDAPERATHQGASGPQGSCSRRRAEQDEAGEDVLGTLMRIVATQLEADSLVQLTPQSPLADLGLDSVQSMVLAQQINRKLGTEVTGCDRTLQPPMPPRHRRPPAGVLACAPGGRAWRAPPQQRALPTREGSPGASVCVPFARFSLPWTPKPSTPPVPPSRPPSLTPIQTPSHISPALATLGAHPLHWCFLQVDFVALMEAETIQGLEQMVRRQLSGRRATPSSMPEAGEGSGGEMEREGRLGDGAWGGWAESVPTAEEQALCDEHAIMRRCLANADQPSLIVTSTVALARVLLLGLFACLSLIPSIVYEAEYFGKPVSMAYYMYQGLYNSAYLNIADPDFTILQFLKIAFIFGMHFKACALGFFVWYIAFKWAVLGRCRVGTFHKWHSGAYGLRYMIWDSFNLMVGLNVLNPLLYLLPDKVNVVFYRLLGAKIGSDVLLPRALGTHTFFWRGVDLLEIGDNVKIDPSADLLTSVWLTGLVVQQQKIVIGSGSLVCAKSRVLGGAHLGAECTVACGATAQGYVDARSIVTHKAVLPPGSPRPNTVVDTMYRLPPSTGLQSVYVFVGQSCVALFLIYFLSSAVITGMCLMTTITSGNLRHMIVYSIITPLSISISVQIHIVLGSVCAKWLLIGKRRPGREKITIASLLARWATSRFVAFGLSSTTYFFDNTVLLSVYFRMLGSSHNLSTIPSMIQDGEAELDLLTIGDRPLAARPALDLQPGILGHPPSAPPLRRPVTGAASPGDRIFLLLFTSHCQQAHCIAFQ
ncbi:hypothetical protein CYMTET_53923 [Cymbomonas tetramitiformis]|uniref:Uncharacterized protein n=1 Tax=Cymbomonas tetramitiformis TaxID=36881 RepID=A0AAE0BFX0_9CHLO|nr:hypothetical protein CYMTET_53923 [Cymbomonas tetramitiformis]